MCDWTRAGSANPPSVLVLVAFYTVFIWRDVLGNFLFLLLLAWLFGLAIDPIVTRLHTRFGMKTRPGRTMLVFLALAGHRHLLHRLWTTVRHPDRRVGAGGSGHREERHRLSNERFNLGLNQATILDQLNLERQDVANIASQAAGGVLGVLELGDRRCFPDVHAAAVRVLFCCRRPATSAHHRVGAAEQVTGGLQRRDHRHRQGRGFVISRLGLAVVSAFFSAIFFIIIGLLFWLPLALWMGLISQFIPTVGTYLAIYCPP